MTLSVMGVVVFAALLHATWNAVLKSGGNHLADSIALSVGAGVLALAGVSFVPFPLPQSWGFLAASVVIHAAYFSLVAFAYRHGDLSVVYPVMRGSAPLLTAVVAFAIIGEPIGVAGWLGIFLLAAGIFVLGTEQLRHGGTSRAAWAFALANAIVIVAYTIVDGLGVRASGHAWSYVLWMFLFNALPMVAIGLIVSTRELRALPARGWLKGLVSGACSLGAYGLALWAMTQAPIALVAALRETSVLFGTAMAALVLGEKFGGARWMAAGLVAAGAAAMKIA